jgi:hypothetical protein
MNCIFCAIDHKSITATHFYVPRDLKHGYFMPTCEGHMYLEMSSHMLEVTLEEAMCAEILGS